MAVAERRFHAMGGTAHILVVGGPSRLLDAAQERIADLEARWSRFRKDSELSMLNTMPEMPVVVSPETFELVDKSVFAWRQTKGRFDPTVEVGALGYDRSFEDVAAEGRLGRYQAAPGCGRIELDRANFAVTLPSGVVLDPGGIGKGLGADVVAREVLASGAAGVMVNLGGDLRVAGEADEADAWTIAIESPFDPDTVLARVNLDDGAVATSSRLERSWQRGDVEYHHLVDPGSGLPFAGDVAAVSVVAGAAWWAEVMTKAVFAVGVANAASVLDNASALIVDVEGSRYETAGFPEVAA